MQRHVNDWVGPLKAAIHFLQILKCNANAVQGMDKQKYNELAAVLHEATDIVAAAEVSIKMEPKAPQTLVQELTQVINRRNLEGGSDTPDFILADYLGRCLVAFDDCTKQRTKWYGLESFSKSYEDGEYWQTVTKDEMTDAKQAVDETLADKFNEERKKATRQIMEDLEKSTSETLHGFEKTFAYVPKHLLEEYQANEKAIAELGKAGKAHTAEYVNLTRRAVELGRKMREVKKEAIEKETRDKMARIVADVMRVSDGFLKAAKAIQIFNREAKEAESTRKKFEHMAPKTGNGGKKHITDENGFLFIGGSGDILWALYDGEKYCFCSWEGSAWVGWQVPEGSVIEASHTQLPLFLDNFIREIMPTK